MLEEVVHWLLMPDVVSYNTAMSACDKGKKWEASVGLLQVIVQRFPKPSVVSCNAAISACEKGT